MSNTDAHWYRPEKFFGARFYVHGDNSCEGYSQHPKTLEERTIEEVQGVIYLLRLRLEDSILDLPCGYGRHSLELAEKGYRNVTGGDLNADHLALARLDAQRRGLIVDFQQVDMLKTSYRNAFNAALNMFFSFGFFPTDEENEQIAKNYYDSLADGGQFLMHTDVNIPRITSGKYKLHEIRHLRGGGELIIREQYDSTKKRIEGSWCIRKDESNDERFYSVRVYTRDEFEALCRKVGFRRCRSYSDWKGAPYNENAEDMIIVAEK